MNTRFSILKWHHEQPSSSGPDPNLRLVLQTIVILSIVIATACGGLTEALAGLLLGRLL